MSRDRRPFSRTTRLDCRLLGALVVSAFLVIGPHPRTATAQEDGATPPDVEIVFSNLGEAKALELTTEIGGQDATARETFKFTLRGEKGKTFAVHFEPEGLSSTLLKDDFPAVVPISAKSIALDPTNIEMISDELKSLTVDVSSIQFPGEYKGRLLYSVYDENGFVGRGKIDIVLRVDLKPIFQMLPEKLAVNLIDCEVLSCWLADLFFSGGAKKDAVVRVQNESRGYIKVSARAFLVGAGGHGELSGRSNGSMEIKTGVSFENPMVIVFDTSKSGAGAFEGKATVRAEALPPFERQVTASEEGGFYTSDVSREIDANINVRVGPFWPLVVILLGIITGRVALAMSGPKTRTQMVLYPRLLELEELASAIRDRASRELVRLDLQDLRHAVERAAKPQDDLSNDIDDLELRVRTLVRLDKIEALVLGSDLGDRHKDTHRGNIVLAREKVLEGALAEAKKTIREIVSALNLRNAAAERLLSSMRTRGQTAKQLAPVKKEADDLNTLTSEANIVQSDLEIMRRRSEQRQAEIKKLHSPRGKTRSFVAGVLSVLSGSQQARSMSFMYWFVQPLSLILLMGALTVQGLVLFYTGDEHSTFGANGLSDYMAVFLWGIGTDVANRTLQGITLPRAS